MAELVRKQKTATKKKADTQEVETPPKTVSDDGLKEETDDLLDEIDGLLEQNAEEFVRAYVQKGGQ